MKTKDNIEELIQNNLDELNDLEPRDGHFERFEATIAETKSKAPVSLATVSPEYKEVEFYFANAISVGLNEWNNLEQEGFVSENEQQLMNSELAEFESRFKTLQADLAANPNDERVINAMLEYYQTKLGIINLIVGKLEEVKQQKINHHETDI